MGSKGVSRACESPNGTHASFDKLSEHMYVVMSHSNLRASRFAQYYVMRHSPVPALAIVIYITSVEPNDDGESAPSSKKRCVTV